MFMSNHVDTFVNSSGVAGDGVAVYCDGTLLVTSNILAYASMHPGNEAPHRAARCSLNATVALSEQTTGVGNKVADGASLFVDNAGKDFHLAANSPAKASAEPGLDLTQDLEGKARSLPAGSRPDIGAYEAP